jgi:hypothetical protein
MRLPRPAMDRIISPRLGLDLDLRVMQMAAAAGIRGLKCCAKLTEGRVESDRGTAKTRAQVLLAP